MASEVSDTETQTMGIISNLENLARYPTYNNGIRRTYHKIITSKFRKNSFLKVLKYYFLLNQICLVENNAGLIYLYERKTGDLKKICVGL